MRATPNSPQPDVAVPTRDDAWQGLTDPGFDGPP
jgi:hypothetical protein